MKMAAVKELLEQYNSLAKKHGKTTFNTWKQPKDKLEARIKDLQKAEGKSIKTEKPVDKVAEKMIEAEAARKVNKDNQLTVVDIAIEIGMNPKVARAKLRRANLHSNEGRWPTYKKGSAEHKDIIALLKAETK
jgi:DNA repair ATPase RecN